jgi:hypothetical protein
MSTCLFAPPKVGNYEFMAHVNDKVGQTDKNNLMIVKNRSDIVPTMPPSSVINVNDKDKPFVYYDYSQDYTFHIDNYQKFLCDNHLTWAYFEGITGQCNIDPNKSVNHGVNGKGGSPACKGEDLTQTELKSFLNII